jgi:hypothetical protein
MVETNVSNSVTFDQTQYNKNIMIPIELKFEPMDYSDLIDNWVDRETQKVINRILDGEKIKYDAVNSTLEVQFRFLNKNDTSCGSTKGCYSSNYAAAGFDVPDDFGFNRFTKSYFRLYFYDSNTGETANLLFTEDFPTTPIDTTVSIPLKKLYWDRDDELMDGTLTNRVVYMEARFFNAKTGQIHTFYNPPIISSPAKMSEYNKVSNRSWRTKEITLINPNNYNGEFRFTPTNGSSTVITMSEFILS